MMRKRKKKCIYNVNFYQYERLAFVHCSFSFLFFVCLSSFVFLLVDIQFIIYTNSGILLRPRTVRSLSFKFCVALFLHLLMGFHLTRRTS